ncbi:MAG: YybH family protein [Cohaesibacteraceae bacterium]
MKLLHKIPTYFLLLAIPLLPSAGTATAGGHSDTAQITELLRSYERHVNEGNAQGVGALYTEDAVFFPDRFEPFEGTEAITGFYSFAFSALSLDLEFAIDPDDIVVAGDTAYATTTSSGTRLFIESDQSVPEVNRELWVFEKVDGDWMIARYAFNKSE